MKLSLIIVILLTIIIISLFTFALRIKLVFNSNNEEFDMTIFWIRPLFKGFISMVDTKPILTIFLFGKEIFKKVFLVAKRPQNKLDYWEITSPKDINVTANYGFKDPFLTGITCAAINIATQFINIDSINNNPDFATSSDYIYLNASANINLGSSLVKLLKTQKGS